MISKMNMAVLAVIFPFVMGIIFWFLFKDKTSDREKNILSTGMIAVSVIELVFAAYIMGCDMGGMEPVIYRIWGVGGLGLHFRYTGFQGIMGILTAFAWFATFLFSKEYMKNDTNAITYDFFNLFTLGATMGIFYAADLFTVFFFFEIMSFTSFMWVAHRKTRESMYAAGTYLGIAVAGGMAILMGLFIVYAVTGTLSFDALYDGIAAYLYGGGSSLWLYVAAGCMFAGFGAKASAFPVHVWLPQSYTQAPAPATALLSAILSKTGVFGILLVTINILPMQGNWGMFVLIIGVITMVLGGIRGVMSSNFKTTLAYSSMSQIGFILVGVGMQGLLSEMLPGAENMGAGGESVYEAFFMAVNGTLLHMINHSLAKLVLFMAAGIVFMKAGSYELNKVRGFGHKKPFLLVTFILGAAGVGGIPLFNGYVSKTLLHESITAYTELLRQYYAGISVFSPTLLKTVEVLFLFSGGLTVAYMTKLFVVLFVEKNADEKLQSAYEADQNYASALSKAAIGLCALPIPFIGILPNIVADRIAAYGFVRFGYGSMLETAGQETVHYFSLENLSGALISIVTGAVVYFLVVRLLMLRPKNGTKYRDIFPAWLDMEKYIYRAVFYTAVPFILGITSRILDSIVDTAVVFLRKTVYCDRPLPYELPEGNRVSYCIGHSIEQMRKLRCIVQKKEYKPENYEHRMALKSTDIFENFRIIERSLSFGLFMFCVGLGLTMLYLLLVN